VEGDWAVVVGVDRYAGEVAERALRGPNRDARAFADWLLAGGGVPADHLRVIPSSFSARPLPSRQDVSDALWDVRNAVLAGGGRRLWLYFAGHGVEIARDGRNEPVLLTARAERGRWTEHIPGPTTADWFRLSGLFEEVVLVMDCCRTLAEQVGVLRLFDDAEEATDRKTRWFFALATRWSRVARERAFPPDDAVRGVFTSALLEGLAGRAADTTGRVTDRSLAEWLYTRVEAIQPGQRPDLRYDTDPAATIVLAQVAPPASFGRIVVKRATAVPIEVWGPTAERVATAPAEAGEWSWDAPARGQYEVVVGDVRWRLRMTGVDEVIDA
jgi:uncharacterized caspase-like protein